MHALRRSSSQTGHPHIQGQVVEHGQLDKRASRGKLRLHHPMLSANEPKNMRRVGNVTNNKLYNPKNIRPSIPIDIDEVDGVMERFIRQKYESRAFQNNLGSTSPTYSSGTASPDTRHNTGSTSSDDRPPTLPPKPKSRFHFPSLRSASSTVPRQGTWSPPISPNVNEYGESSPPHKSKTKPAKFLGAELGGMRDDGMERKVQYLRDMGFLDERRNTQVLKALHGDVDKAVETLIRIGDNGGESSQNQLPTPRLTPVNGITVVDKTQVPPATFPSNNPFDRPDTNKSLPLPPMSPSSYNTSQQQAYNPFMQQGQQHTQIQQPSIDQAFSGLAISQQPQPTGQQTAPLFPHSTGGHGNNMAATSNPFLQQAAPPMPQSSQQYNQFAAPVPFNPQPQTQGYAHAQYSSMAPNPFLRTSRSQIFNTGNAFDTQAPFNAYSNQASYAQPSAIPSNQSNSFNPFQPAQISGQSVFGPASHTQNFGSNPYNTMPPESASFLAAGGPVQQPQPQPQPQPQSTMAQPIYQVPQSAPPQQQSMFQPPAASYDPRGDPQPQTMAGRHDKTSILALYGMPHLAPAKPDFSTTQPQNQSTIVHDFAAPAPHNGHPVPQRSVTMPAGHLPQQQTVQNPFAALAPLARPNAAQHSSAFAMSSGLSRESVDFAGLALMNGRHSPDAFSGLSARLT